MVRLRIILLLAVLSLSLPLMGQKYENLGRTPQMGWNSWNKFASNINENLIKETADLMASKGLLDAGYVYLNLDDCWHGERDSLGFISENGEKFPSGMKALGEYIHSKGLKFGIYSDAGCKTCGGHTGSLGHEYQDAVTYARWGVDYLKYDWCNTKDINPIGAYKLMRDALRFAGRPVFFSICEWGDNKPWLWAQEVGHSWRTTGDIFSCFDCIKDYGTWKSYGVLQILDKQEGLRKYAGPGHWNDPDMLEVGNGMSVNEDRAHFTMWCMLAAPLILGNDLATMSQQTLDIITNKEVIAIDQDSLGVQGFRAASSDGLEFWLKPLAGKEWAFCILNRSTDDKSCTIDWNRFNLKDSLSGMSTSFDKISYKVRDLWVKANAGTTDGNRTVIVRGHDVLLYRLCEGSAKSSVSINVPLHQGWLWYGAQKPEIKAVVYNNSDKPVVEELRLDLATDKREDIGKFVKRVKVAPHDSSEVMFGFGVKPGFYRVRLSASDGWEKRFNIGYEPERIVSPVDAQPDLREFWDKAKSDLSKIAPDYSLTLLEDKSTDKRKVYMVKMLSLDSVVISGYYVTPVKPGKYPALIGYMGYGSKPWCPDPDSNPGFVEFVLSVRGQALNEPDNKYGDWIRWNLQDRDKYYYRGAYMDLVRAVDFVASRREVDTLHIFAEGGSQGGAFTLAACALDHRICAAAPFIPFLSDFPDYFRIVHWPAEPVFAEQKRLGLSDEGLYKTLSYFDIKNLAGWIKAPILMAFGLQDDVCPPHTNFAGYNQITSQKSFICYPLKGHDVESDWWQKRMEFFSKFLNK